MEKTSATICCNSKSPLGFILVYSWSYCSSIVVVATWHFFFRPHVFFRHHHKFLVRLFLLFLHLDSTTFDYDRATTKTMGPVGSWSWCLWYPNWRFLKLLKMFTRHSWLSNKKALAIQFRFGSSIEFSEA